MRPLASPARRPRAARALLAAFAALALGPLAPASARASTILSFAFQGVVSDVGGDNGFFGPPGSVQVGDVFSGHFAYEIGAANPDQLPGDPEIGVYDLLDFGLDQAVVPLTPVGVEVRHEPGGITIPPAPPDWKIGLPSPPALSRPCRRRSNASQARLRSMRLRWISLVPPA